MDNQYMKKLFLFILICGNINYFCFAQPVRNNRAEALFAAYVTKQLSLTSEEAQGFWPVYQSYRSELKKARQAHKDELEWEETVLNIRKKYRISFKKILVDDKRVNGVFKAERSFRTMLRNEQARRQNKQRSKSKDSQL
ncbi:hypothetical protein EXU57_17455 [Segetibacter sp. 3557_3]|uniref:hypothetical protein n=1 Tax=Segetibacter sp. 3557_3 TaxID=2547429 RepID=UPI001058AF91|nr:hypothetical protein [Segetibacter sp. 3557_3]TDH23261.1 hypothetical protein EXU57_17455 [Segetibacter sp. 3557_3]